MTPQPVKNFIIEAELKEVRCANCNRMVCKATQGSYLEWICKNCKALNQWPILKARIIECKN